ncbi:MULTISPECIES: hypothetical protein [Burkholderia]|uniref:hypothetical protein n=1 Tax=Burkholderia TaxID=32008 RepID=UPI00157B6D4B|nr:MULTISPECIES: hypothetical protein [Burkholderia]MCU9953826.1 hypothetical protein [Burkholderia sp. BKH01]NTY35887.1 hypothetical protein [Burkholderia diffusa]
MNKSSLRPLALAVLTGVVLLGAPVAYAQDSDAAPAAATAPMSKQELKAQRKAQRKEARLKRNQELRTLEKNGYRVSKDDHYPQSLQRAEHKAAEQKAAAGASAPGQ